MDGQRNPQSRSHSAERVQHWWVVGGEVRDSWSRMYTVNVCPQSSVMDTCILHGVRDSSVIIISSSLIFFQSSGCLMGIVNAESMRQELTTWCATDVFKVSWEISRLMWGLSPVVSWLNSRCPSRKQCNSTLRSNCFCIVCCGRNKIRKNTWSQEAWMRNHNNWANDCWPSRKTTRYFRHNQWSEKDGKHHVCKTGVFPSAGGQRGGGRHRQRPSKESTVIPTRIARAPCMSRSGVQKLFHVCGTLYLWAAPYSRTKCHIAPCCAKQMVHKLFFRWTVDQ